MLANFNTLLTILIGLEIFEIIWQKGDTTRLYLENLMSLYQKGLILFLLAHPSFYFVLIVCLVGENFSVYMIFLLGLKMLDLVMKINILDKSIKNHENNAYEVLYEGNFPFPLYLKVVPIFISVSFFYLAFS